jgi:hypothetical protein
VTGLVESWARQIGWQVCERNVIVEGGSDVALLTHARHLFLAERRLDIFGGDLAILAAGRGDDGGVDGVNRRLNAARQIAEADLGPDGALRYRFIGLFDNDEAGRRAMRRACDFDRRTVRYQDVFLLHPIMPPANGSTGPVVEQRAQALNGHVRLDWEIEDLLSSRLLQAFQATTPGAVVRETTAGGFRHRDFTREGKADLLRFVRSQAAVEDVMGLVQLVCALRDYLQLQFNHLTGEH